MLAVTIFFFVCQFAEIQYFIINKRYKALKNALNTQRNRFVSMIILVRNSIELIQMQTLKRKKKQIQNWYSKNLPNSNEITSSI